MSLTSMLVSVLARTRATAARRAAEVGSAAEGEQPAPPAGSPPAPPEAPDHRPSPPSRLEMMALENHLHLIQRGA